MSTEEKNAFDKEVALVQIEIANETNKNIQQLLSNEWNKVMTELEEVNRRVAQDYRERDLVKEMYKQAGEKRGQKDPYQTLREIPK